MTLPAPRQRLETPCICHNLHVHATSRVLEPSYDVGVADTIAAVFAMLADSTRVRIILALNEFGDLSVNHLADIVDRSPSSVSQHLATMRVARMVSTRQDAQRVFYRLENEHARQLVLDALLHLEHIAEGVPTHHRYPSSAPAEGRS